MKKMSTLLPRAITGVIYVAVILGAIASGSLILLGLLLAVIAGLACYEYQRIVGINNRDFIMSILHSVMAGLAFYVTFATMLWGTAYRFVTIALFAYFLYYLLYTLGELFRKERLPFHEIAHAFYAHLYTAVPLGLLLALTVKGYDATFEGLTEREVAFATTFWALPVFVLVWLSDTGAFLVGSLIGKHKLFERISPNKTIEGAVGGILITLLGGYLFYIALPGVALLRHWLCIALIASSFSIVGDLYESFLKRTYGKKDSGHLLPGHGGFLDRIDSILFVAPAVYFYIALAM